VRVGVVVDESQADLAAERVVAAAGGMGLAVTARHHPLRPALIAGTQTRTFAELNARCNQLARVLRRHGLKDGDAVALVCSNRPEFAEAVYAAQRSGLRITPINWHLTAEEIAYIVSDCEARALIAEVQFASSAAEAGRGSPNASVRLAIGGVIGGFEPYEAALAAEPDHDLEDPTLGQVMFYTSGTTGRPKGVWRPNRTPQEADTLLRDRYEYFRYQEGQDSNLVTGPLYHGGPFAYSLTMPLSVGVGTVVMDRWGSEDALRLIEQHRITHTHMVPIMFHRLLELPESVRRRYDLSSLRVVVHGAAPCPVETKRSMMQWLGPIVYEYYGATEGRATFIDPIEWLRKPGSVGRPNGGHVDIQDSEGNRVPPGVVGTVYLRAPDSARFEYFKDGEKTSSVYRGDRFTVGDMGYIDDDGYLFLTARTAEVIISGGVNIYPAEVDGVLLGHPVVADVATVGVPNREWGEEVKSVVILRPGVRPDTELARELADYVRANLAHYKCPRSIDFAVDLPRDDNGKIYRRRVRDRYWTEIEKRAGS
jgi:long-chain acyl-CoA synthetase